MTASTAIEGMPQATNKALISEILSGAHKESQVQPMLHSWSMVLDTAGSVTVNSLP